MKWTMLDRLIMVKQYLDENQKIEDICRDFNNYDKTKQTKGIIVQSDLGSQYLSYDVEQFIENYEMAHSYSRKGTPYDNAPIETFHSIIKQERLSRMVLKTFEEARMVIFEYVEGVYNRKKIHSSIDY